MLRYIIIFTNSNKNLLFIELLVLKFVPPSRQPPPPAHCGGCGGGSYATVLQTSLFCKHFLKSKMNISISLHYENFSDKSKLYSCTNPVAHNFSLRISVPISLNFELYVLGGTYLGGLRCYDEVIASFNFLCGGGFTYSGGRIFPPEDI